MNAPPAPPKPTPSSPPKPGHKLTPKPGPLAFVGTSIFALAILVVNNVGPSEGGQILKPYLDSVGIPTACRGLIGPKITAAWKAKVDFTKVECDAMEQEYAQRELAKMRVCVPKPVTDQITVALLLAYSHWSWNTGTNAYCGNTTFHRRLVAEDWEGTCKAMGAWVFVTHKGKKLNCREGGRICPGIVTRRDNEVATCLAALH